MQVDLFGNIIIEEETYELKQHKPSPFEFLTKIGDKKPVDDLYGFNPWLTNSAFSQRQDTVLAANEINKYHLLGDREHFDFYYHILPKKKYFAKWAKDIKSPAEDALKEYYNVSSKVAKEYEKVLTSDQIRVIMDWYSTHKGGR